MKLIFNCVLFFFVIHCTQGLGREVILIENRATRSELDLAVKVLQEKFNIPKKLITTRTIVHQCSINSDAIMHLCLEEGADLKIVKMDKFVVENTLRVFLEMGEK